MRAMPRLQDGAKSTLMTTTFLGYNHNEIIQDGEMYDMKNLSGDMYPLMTPRKKRAWTSFQAGEDVPLTGINGRDQLTLIAGNRVYWNLEEVTGLEVSTAPAMCPKKIVNFGAYVCIFPDRKYFNTINLEDFGSIDRPYAADGTDVTLTMCRGDGTDYDMSAIAMGPEPPADPENGQMWMDQSGENDVLRQYTATTQEWTEVPTTYVKIGATGIGTGLNIYDGITLSGLAADNADPKVAAQVQALNGSKIVYYGGENYIVVMGLLSQTQEALTAGEVRADRTMPEMDWIVESNNRLWGCHYGMVNGQVVNEIYASALGDFRCWNRYLGNSQDSYTASVGTDGPFTAAVSQKGYPVFFKENCIHQVYGSTPGSFQIRTTMCRGVQRGSGRSAVVVNEQVYYKSRTDVMMFDGSMPVSVSAQLGRGLYSDARAGALGAKYYISMKDAGNEWSLFTYDTEKKVWYREDGFHALGFGRVQDEIYAIDEENNLLWSMNGTMGTIEDEMEWEAEFGLFGTDVKGKKYLSRFDIRMYLEEGATARMRIQYDGDGVWRDRGEIRGNRLRSFVLPVVPRRCDHLRVRLEGSGDMRIYSIARIMEGGEDG